MTTPVTLVTGVLGAGKTTFINRNLEDASGLRVAAIVNDFGAINIDADLIAESTDTVIGLKNGCICCSLQGDLLRTLKQVVGTKPVADHIIIEASGVADPQGIIETLMDPVVREAVRLDAIVAVVDVAAIADDSTSLADPLWRAQTDAADFIALSKTAGHDTAPLRERFRALGKALVFDSAEPVALELLLRPASERTLPPRRTLVTADRFATVEWQWEGDIAAERFQSAIGKLAPQLVRAKGIINLSGRKTSFSFNLVSRRATLEALARHHKTCRLVLIGERGKLDVNAARQLLLETFADMSLVAQNG